MKKSLLLFALIALVSCAPADKVEGVYHGYFYESGDSAQGAVKIIPMDGETVGVLFSSPYGNLTGNGVDVTENGNGFDLYKNGYTPYSNIVLYVNGSVVDNTLQIDYTSSNSTYGSFKGQR